VATDVVGVDASDDMLDVARRKSTRPGVSFTRADMRSFDLGRTFDAAVCASNSLNNMADRAELRQVFGRVARHLRPGGVFAFDVVSDYGMRLASYFWSHMTLGELRFATGSGYDSDVRRETAWTILPNGMETHMRSPIDKKDVRVVAAETGLAVVDQFSNAGLLGGWGEGALTYHVLRRVG
jgi:SAM-dependent methyltransferase